MTDTPATADFRAVLDQIAADQGLALPAPERFGPAYANFHDAATGDRAWIRDWTPDAGPSVSLARGGVTLANGHAPDLVAAVRAVVAWLAGADLAAARAATPFLVVHDWAFAHESEPLDEAELVWRQRLGRFDTQAPHYQPPGYRALFEAAFAEPRLRRLTPVTSHFTLWFSATPKYPYQPVGRTAIEPLRDGTFLVSDAGPAATAEEAVALAVATLPPGY
ncbi:DUF6193 family natural product biosynthesis protein [Kitasatospora sp. NPDC059673]|uniref:DUF6193 family natural product biosynthesis protein n=1 Tax=Kitasatospora sp. NPDC059673 TaxID=3346901 RepID=UPI00368DE78E